MEVLLDLPKFDDDQVLLLGTYIIQLVSTEKERNKRAVHRAKIVGVIKLEKKHYSNF